MTRDFFGGILVPDLEQTTEKEQGAIKVINQNKFSGAIRAAGYTQKKLAEKMHMTQNTFTTKKKNGTFTLRQVDELCEILQISRSEDKCSIFLA